MNIVKRIFVGVSIAMIVWFLKSEVFAATQSRMSYRENGTTIETSYVNVNSLMTITTGNSEMYDYLRMFVRFGDTFNQGYYQFTIIFNAPSPDLQQWCSSISSSGAVNSSNNSTLSSLTCSFNGTFQYTVTGNVYIPSTVSYLTIGLNFFSFLNSNSTYNFRVTTAGHSDIDGTMDAIINQTDTISNAISGISGLVDYQTVVVESIRDLLSDFIYSTGSSESATIYATNYEGIDVDGYNSAHTSGTSAGGSGLSGANNLSFDVEHYSSGSTTIWSFLSRILNAHSEFILYFTSVLTLGFVRVVLNR